MNQVLLNRLTFYLPIIVVIGFLFNHVGQSSCHDALRYDKQPTKSTCETECSKCYTCCMAECGGSSQTSTTPCMSLTEVSKALWEIDINRLDLSDLNLDHQTKIDRKDRKDRSPNKLFNEVNETKFDTPTYQAFFKLLDNYEPEKGTAESESSEEIEEINLFLDAVLDTKVMGVLFDYLHCQGSVTSKSDLKSVLHKLWFHMYNRSPKYDDHDTSGFEHVMVGEYKSSYSVNGFHSWLSFYVEEKKGNLNYFGYIDIRNPNILVIAFLWNGHVKALSSFFIGVSPEFDLAIYTLCFLHRGGPCHLSLDGNDVVVQTYNKDGHVATAFIKMR